MNQTLRFNRLFPGLLLAAALLGTIALGISAVSYHLDVGRPWTAAWVAFSYLVLGAILLASAYGLAVRDDAPDCRSLYLASGAAVAVLAAAYIFPTATARAPLAVLNFFVPGIDQEFDRLEKKRREVVASFPSATAAPQGTESGK